MRRTAIYHFGQYEAGSRNGITRVIYSYSEMLGEETDFHVFHFKRSKGRRYYVCERFGQVMVHRFGRVTAGILLPKEWRNWLDRFPEDAVVHLHGPYRVANYGIARALVKRGVAYIFTPHDPYAYDSLSRHRILKYAFLRSVGRYVLRHAAVVHALNDDQVQDLRTYGAKRVVTIPNFVVDPGMSKDTTERLSGGICFVGRLDVFAKGIDVMLASFARLLEYVERRVTFTLIGAGDPASVDQIKRHCEDLRLEFGRQVVLLGQVEEEEKSAVVKLSRVYLHLSRYEGFGLSTVEAMATGTPVVVSSRVPIKVSDAGVIGGFKVDGAVAAADALAGLFEMSPADYAALSSGARRIYEENYSSRAVVRKIMQMYEEVGKRNQKLDRPDRG